MNTKVEVTSTGKTVSIDFKEIFNAKSQAVVEESLKLLQSSAQDAIRFRRKSGRLESAVKYRVNDDQHGEMFVDLNIAPYGRFIMEGTGLYGSRHKAIVTVARGGGTMSWEQHGQRGFASVVHNPGFRGQPFVDDSLDRCREGLDNLWDGAFDEVMKEVGF